MNESWVDSVRFSLTALLAACLFAIAMLSPLIVRNENFKQLCYEKQLELIDLEAENIRRELFAQRIENSPELMEQISRQRPTLTGIETVEKSFDLPESLAIHPDQMLIASVRDEKKQSKIKEIPKKNSSSKSRFFDIARMVADSSRIQKRLLIASIILLLLGIVPASWFHWKFFRRQLEFVTTHFLSRYRNHSAHTEIPSPHWESSQLEGGQSGKHSLHGDTSSQPR